MDVVGLEVGSSSPEGVPAVRIRKTEGRVELVAAGFLNLPARLPSTPQEAEAACAWTLPRPFQAPYAALALTSTLGFLRHVTGPADEESDGRQLPQRTASKTFGDDLPTLRAGLPEFQAAWAARLLPEGRSPTACSLQVSAAACVNTFTASPLFPALTSATLVMFVSSERTSLVAFDSGQILLYREHPIGYGHVRSALSSQMRIDASLVDSVLQDTLIDPLPLIEPTLKTLFRQVEISSDYLLRRRNCQIQRFYLCGVPSGAKYWASVFTRAMSHPLAFFHPFDGLAKPHRGSLLPPDLAASEPHLTVALGAARGAMEDV